MSGSPVMHPQTTQTTALSDDDPASESMMKSPTTSGRESRGNEYPIPATMKAWVLGDPEELALVEKPVPQPGPAEVLVRVDAIAVCATDIEIITHGLPAMVDGGLPFNRGFTPGH